MSMDLRMGGIGVTHADSDKNKQIYMAAEAIWGIKSDQLPLAKFNELKRVLEGNLERKYGPYRVMSKPLGSGNVFLISMDPKVMDASYTKRPCSLDTCMVTDAALQCSRCRTAIYCSKDHQRSDWSRHKVECKPK